MLNYVSFSPSLPRRTTSTYQQDLLAHLKLFILFGRELQEDKLFNFTADNLPLVDIFGMI